ncbi:hypothetical protein AMELA_G00174390 [Ameiurus melas]|uniref:Uncharacterized protein n=1 Tax=Ameiurus melas TaxID=219545 RepID=A0A7J6AFB1_AMEME|nr:hypothetical protein AMELA_G00174390 [Ameiurus melas]
MSILENKTRTKTKGHGEPGAYPWEHRAQGGGHPGQGACPSQGTITHSRFTCISLCSLVFCQEMLNSHGSAFCPGNQRSWDKIHFSPVGIKLYLRI